MLVVMIRGCHDFREGSQAESDIGVHMNTREKETGEGGVETELKTRSPNPEPNSVWGQA